MTVLLEQFSRDEGEVIEFACMVFLAISLSFELVFLFLLAVEIVEVVYPHLCAAHFSLILCLVSSSDLLKPFIICL